jgi:predicted O-methyltransferase YrrM
MLPHQRPEGWFTDQDGDFYLKAVQQFLPVGGQMIEIGTFLGRSLSFIGPLVYERRGLIHCIDPWAPSDEDTSDYYRHEDICKRFHAWLKEQPWRSCVHTIRARSDQAVVHFEQETIDLVFIDGDHEEEAVKKDIELYLPLLKPEGMIAGHDYGRIGVNRAVFTKLGKINGVKGSCWFKRISHLCQP